MKPEPDQHLRTTPPLKLSVDILPHTLLLILALSFTTAQVDHAHCIRLYAVYVTPKKVFIVTELVVGGELLDWYAAIGRMIVVGACQVMHCTHEALTLSFITHSQGYCAG